MQLLDAASREFLGTVRQLPAGSWSVVTPADMTVGAVVDHVVAGNLFSAQLLAGRSREAARSAADSEPTGGDVTERVDRSLQAQAAAFRDADPDLAVPLPFGDVSVQAFLRFRLVDLVVHAWDVRYAAGIGTALDPSVVERLWSLVEPHLDEMVRTGAYGDGPSGALPAGATVLDRLVDAFGRRP